MLADTLKPQRSFFMKKLMSIFIVGVVLFCVCSVQKAEAQTIAQKIIGTWTDEANGGTWIFNADGTGTKQNESFNFTIIDTKLAMLTKGRGYCEAWDVLISSDGKRLLLLAVSGCTWLTKK